jgi:hypothetical protein
VRRRREGFAAARATCFQASSRALSLRATEELAVADISGSCAQQQPPAEETRTQTAAPTIEATAEKP